MLFVASTSFLSLLVPVFEKFLLYTQQTSFISTPAVSSRVSFAAGKLHKCLPKIRAANVCLIENNRYSGKCTVGVDL